MLFAFEDGRCVTLASTYLLAGLGNGGVRKRAAAIAKCFSQLSLSLLLSI